MLEMQVNGRPVALDVEPEMPLLWVLRDELGLTGSKYGCGVGVCGACTVHVDGAAVRACVLPVSEVAGKSVTTIEALAAGGLHPIQEAWIELQVPQCGYCQSGMIMSVAALLASTPDPTDGQIDDAVANICRCGTYVRVRRAIRTLAAKRGK